MYKKRLNNSILILILAFIITLPACNENTSHPEGQPNDSFMAPETEAPPPVDTSWSFAVMGDTQWTISDDPARLNDERVAGSFIEQMNQQFIDKGVEFVIQVGDLTDTGTTEGIEARAAYAQTLYDAGIGFFGMRGNHETYAAIFGATPNGFCIDAIQTNFPQNQGLGDNLFGATNFSSPTNDNYPNMETELNGISYAFDYDDGDGNSATFVIFDTWETPLQSEVLYSVDWHGLGVYFIDYNYGYRVEYQQPWISERLDATIRGTEHAFIFSHQPLIAADHSDSPFGFLDEHVDAQNTFYSELVTNDAAFYISGHDHQYQRSVVESPDGLSSIEQLISAPACPKFYRPDYAGVEWRGQKDRQTVISSELLNTGFYIYTVDGPIVIADYYADSTGGYGDTDDFPFPVEDDPATEDVDESLPGTHITPTFNFVKKETWTFSLNGQAFMVEQGEDYAAVTDTYEGTTVSLTGTNNSTSVEDSLDGADATAAAMPLTKRITTAWKDKAQFSGIDSNAVILTGLAETGDTTTDKYILSMSATGVTPNLGTRIVSLNSDGEWDVVYGSYTTAAPDITYDVGTWVILLLIFGLLLTTRVYLQLLISLQNSIFLI